LKKDDAADGKLIKQEHQEKGAVSAIVYLHYIKACGVAYVVLVMTLMVAQYAVLIGSNFWLSVWGEDSTEYKNKMDVYLSLGNSTNATIPVSFCLFFPLIIFPLILSPLISPSDIVNINKQTLILKIIRHYDITDKSNNVSFIITDRPIGLAVILEMSRPS
jgi:hypothetical protein